ncbi:radical SAM protein [Candidatus Bathyarchaeota archaeon]|nr:radical SAM protein [Candidatus Bathyarchaeota archaeon]
MTLRKAANIIKNSMAFNRPQHVQWFLTRRCNYRCNGCNIWQDQDYTELSTEDVKRGLDILRKMGALEVVFSGGNPLLRDDIDEILEYASKFFVTTVYDNGSLAAKKIDALRHADFVAISLDSLNPKKNDYLKGVKGAWQKAMESIQTLKENGILVSVSPTISQYNLNEILDLTRYFVERDIPVWYCLYSYDPPEHVVQAFSVGRKREDYTITDKEGLLNLCCEIMKMRSKYNNILITTDVLSAIMNLYSTGKRTWKCQALQNFIVINHRGEVSGCHLHEPVCSIYELPRIWNNPRLNILRRKYQECSKCTYLCYIFYSLHGNPVGNLQIIKEHWKNVKLLIKRNNNHQKNGGAARI